MIISKQRLIDRIETLAQIGRTADGGVTRVSWSPEYLEAEAQVRQWMEAAGLAVRRDAIGNLIGRREGRRADAAAIMIGSHIDSVTNGGRFDGVAGVLTGIEVAHALHEEGHSLDHALEVVAFVEEEGTRLGAGILGSRAMVGELGSEVRDLRDRWGTRFDEVLREAGLDPERIGEARRPSDEIAAYLELHLEQGAVLESEGHPVGVVTAIVGITFLELTLVGQADHAGATPMQLRRDALAGAAEIVLATERIAREQAGTAVGTVGELDVSPGQINIVPGTVRMTFDLRDVDAATLATMERDIRSIIDQVAEERALDATLKSRLRAEPVAMDSVVISAIVEGCRAAHLPPFKLPSGAGHDAMVLGRHVPVGMLFVRCKDGISHAPQEYVAPGDLEAGARALYYATRSLDSVI